VAGGFGCVRWGIGLGSIEFEKGVGLFVLPRNESPAPSSADEPARKVLPPAVTCVVTRTVRAKRCVAVKAS
jgi:hypothetical protein